MFLIYLGEFEMRIVEKKCGYCSKLEKLLLTIIAKELNVNRSGYKSYFVALCNINMAASFVGFRRMFKKHF